MATEKERKISFGTLISRAYKTHEETPFSLIVEVIKHNLKLKKLDRQFDLKDSKFCFIDNAAIETDDVGIKIISGYFKSARNDFRPNLIDKKTGEERKSPKKLSEGDIEKTHFVIKIGADEVFYALELNGNGLSINQIIGYFSNSLREYLISKQKKKNFSIIYTKLCKEDFLDTLKKLKRTKVAEVFMNKSLLGSAALNFSNRTISLKRDVIVTATAEPRESITETAIDFYNSFSNNASSGISKVRIYGVDENNTNVMLDTAMIEKVDHLDISINPETGEIVTTEILSGLKGLLIDYK
ncbi:hypothetical protein [Mucilaginibacter sp.]|uniref:hypothetical protein n=1 Tax=Mucilaginibacter sp. TaxID=1882438 RepID=UPI003D0CA5BF